MAYLQTEIISHTRKVCSLYKKAARTLLDWAPDKLCYRYRVTILRHEFEQNRHVKDHEQIKTLIQNAEEELLKNKNPTPLKFANSPGGVAYGRELQSPDWVLDYWSPEEKAQYPEYFARREQRKKEYVAYWEQKFGVKAEEPHHHH